MHVIRVAWSITAPPIAKHPSYPHEVAMTKHLDMMMSTTTRQMTPPVYATHKKQIYRFIVRTINFYHLRYELSVSKVGLYKILFTSDHTIEYFKSQKLVLAHIGYFLISRPMFENIQDRC